MELASKLHQISHGVGDLAAEAPAGWLMAKSSGEIPGRSIKTAAKASAMAIAIAELAVSMRLTAQT